MTPGTASTGLGGNTNQTLGSFSYFGLPPHPHWPGPLARRLSSVSGGRLCWPAHGSRSTHRPSPHLQTTSRPNVISWTVRPANPTCASPASSPPAPASTVGPRVQRRPQPPSPPCASSTTRSSRAHRRCPPAVPARRATEGWGVAECARPRDRRAAGRSTAAPLTQPLPGSP